MATGPDDLIYQAEVVDKTGQFFDRFAKRADETFGKASSAFANFEKSIGGIGSKIGVLGGLIGGVTGALATAGLNKLFEIGDSFQQFAAGAAQLRARADTLAVSLNLIGKNAGYTEEQLSGIEDGMRKTGISIITARQSMAQWIQSNLDLSKASDVARAAQDAAVIAGLNSSETFQRITHAAITLQPELLRSLNLYVDMEGSMKRYAKESGKTVKQLSAQEKQQAFLNEVLRVSTVNAGAYESALDTVGKKQASLERITEDLQVALGAVFQPAMGAIVDKQTEVYKDLTKFLEEHEEELLEFGDMVANVFGVAIDVLIALGKQLTLMPSYIKDVSLELAQLLWQLSDEEIAEREANLSTYFKQAIVVIYTTFQTGVAVITEAAGIAGDMLKAFFDSIGNMEGIPEETIAKVQQRVDNFWLTVAEKSNQAAIEVGKYTGYIEDMDEKSEDAESSTNDLAKGIKDIGEASEDAAKAIEDANKSLAKFYRDMQQDVIQQQLDETRQAIEDALQEAWRLEDLARKHQEAVSSIMENAQESRREAMENHSESLLDIERNYQRQLRDIQQDFEYEASELSRARDAIGLLRLMRQKDRELKEAKEARDDAKEDSDRDYQKQLQEIDQRRQQALRDLAEQEAKEAAEYQRGLERQEELQRLHDQWEEEDRQRTYAERLADLLGNFGDMETLTEDGLATLLEKWSVYFGDLLEMAQEYNQQLQDLTNPSSTGTGTSNSGAPTSTGGPFGGDSGHPSGNIGQAGQVSQLLTAPAMLSPQMTLPRVPSVSPSKSSDRREIDVNVRGEAMEPYMQRVLATALMEIERNRGS